MLIYIYNTRSKIYEECIYTQVKILFLIHKRKYTILWMVHNHIIIVKYTSSRFIAEKNLKKFKRSRKIFMNTMKAEMRQAKYNKDTHTKNKFKID